MTLTARLACLLLPGLLTGLISQTVFAGEAAAKANERPLKALLVTGGCCHDYARQKRILTQGVNARINVDWTVVHQGGSTTDTKIPLYEDENWADGFDVIVHNECFAKVTDPEWVDRVLKPHREGTPAVLIHCAMHCYRTGDDRWFEFCGIQSPGHGPKYAFVVENLDPTHPIMNGFGKTWTTPMGELYHSIRVFDTATPLGHAKRKSDEEPQVCVWTNQYHKARVFATTIGHHNETMAAPHYLDMIARGINWATGRESQVIRKTDEKTNVKILELINAPLDGSKAKEEAKTSDACCGAGNLTFGQKTSASTEEANKNNMASHAVDGDLKTRWCAANSNSGHWWQVNLGSPTEVASFRILWEGNAAYKYTVEGSTDGETWQQLAAKKKNKKKSRYNEHKVKPTKVQYLRVTYLGSDTGAWGSIREFEAFPGELPELPAALKADEGKGAEASVADVKAPEEFEVTMFGEPPAVNYPVCLSCAPNGDVYVGVDEMGSLGKEAGRGKILRCRDRDGDGQAEDVVEFAKIDHPRGLIYDNGKLWVLSPPQLVVFHDDDLDGVADRKEVLIEGISTEYVGIRGADHTTNGIRMGIDGWIYIAVGDYGVTAAKGTDGRVLNRRGGGIIRVRPDGTDMEFFAWGLRNILDVCIDPYMNIFTRDNTNDGGGWDVRVSHIMQGAEYGYPSWYANFGDEIMPPLADYGGGSGCGGMYLHDARWPELYGNTLYTCDWGRSQVYRHNLPETGATFEPHQEVFLDIPRPTDIDVDASGLMYVSSWKGGKFAYGGPNVGFVAQLRPKNFLPKPFPELSSLSIDELVDLLAAPSEAQRLPASRELLRRPQEQDVAAALLKLIRNNDAPLYGRVAAIFTYKQALGAAANFELIALAKDDALREFALKALTDRTAEIDGLSADVFVDALSDSNPRVQAQALMSLARLGDETVAEKVLPLAVWQPEHHSDMNNFHKQADPSRVIPHLAVRALVALDAWEVCLDGLDGPHRSGALWALRYMHRPEVVAELSKRLAAAEEFPTQMELFSLLCRLHFEEGPYEKGWWGTRPDHSGPYFSAVEWEGTKAAAAALTDFYKRAPEKTRKHLDHQLARHKVTLPEVPTAGKVQPAEMASDKPVEVPKFDPNNKHQIGNLKYERVKKLAMNPGPEGSVSRGAILFGKQACNACHTYAPGQQPKGPHLVDIGKRYKREELIESILKPSEKIAQGFDTYIFVTDDGKQHIGFVASQSAETTIIRKNDGQPVELLNEAIEVQVKQEQSMMPAGLVNNLTAEQLADLLDYLESLRTDGAE